VTDATNATLFRIDPATMTAQVKATLDPTPCELTYAFGALWVSTQSGYLDRVDLATGAVTKARVGEKSYEVEAAAGALWVSDRDSAQLTHVDPRTLRTSRLPLPGTKPGGLVYAFGYLWVGDDTAGASKVLRIDPVRRTVRRVAAGSRPAYVTATSTAVWASDVESGSVSRIDPTSLTATTTRVGSSPVNLDVLHDQVWVPDDTGNAVYRLDARGAVAQTYPAGDGGPAVVAPVGDALWVTLFAGGDVWQITPG
jgi:streptogramin lyase